MDFITSLKTCFSKYATFEGRARRSEFWWFYLAVCIGGMIPVVGGIVWIACLLPMIAAGVRRLHDLGKSGWFYLLLLIPIVNIVLLIIWFAKEGDQGANLYGPNPKA